MFSYVMTFGRVQGVRMGLNSYRKFEFLDRCKFIDRVMHVPSKPSPVMPNDVLHAQITVPLPQGPKIPNSLITPRYEGREDTLIKVLPAYAGSLLTPPTILCRSSILRLLSLLQF